MARALIICFLDRPLVVMLIFGLIFYILITFFDVSFAKASFILSWLSKLAKSLFIFLFFSFLIYNYKMEHGKVSCDFVTMVWQIVTDGHVTGHITRYHMTRVAWGPWENKRIATVVKCISSRELSENPIKFSLSNSEQRDSWLNSGHQTLDADISWESPQYYVSN